MDKHTCRSAAMSWIILGLSRTPHALIGAGAVWPITRADVLAGASAGRPDLFPQGIKRLNCSSKRAIGAASLLLMLFMFWEWAA